jgi:3-methyladenine DNA glycosylase AlkD
VWEVSTGNPLPLVSQLELEYNPVGGLMHPYVTSLKILFEQHADSAQSGPMKKYMRDQFEYLGIKSPQFKVLFNQQLGEHGLPLVGELDGVVHELWDLPQREFQYAAVGLVARSEKQLPSSSIKTLEYMITHKSWWDTVDSIAGGTLGVHFKRFPKVREKYLTKWRASENFWLRRTTILFQLNYKKETDFDLLCDIIRENLGSKEFFINKAIGWSLRQYARVDPKAVKKFVNTTKGLNPLSRREAMKHL